MPRSNSPGGRGRRKPDEPGAGRGGKRPDKRRFDPGASSRKRESDDPRAGSSRRKAPAQGTNDAPQRRRSRPTSDNQSKPSFFAKSSKPSGGENERRPARKRGAKDISQTGRPKPSRDKSSKPSFLGKPSGPSRDRDQRKPPFRDRGDGQKTSSFPEKRPDDARPLRKFDRAGLKRSGKSLRGEPQSDAPAPGGAIRLNKYIANSGVCSRREADELITMGLISVNGKVVTTLGFKVNPGDEVRHESKVLKAEKPVYILMNKPKGFLTTTSDPAERSTVMNLVSGVVKERIYPVGRLDRNTTGLLLLTNDGELAEKLMHPSYNVKKIYRVELDRPLTKTDATRIMEGVNLEEGRAVVDDLAVISDDKKTIGLEIHIGWNRVVRRIFEALDYQVVKLDRTSYAGLTKKDLGRSEWRFLTREEIVLLKHYK